MARRKNSGATGSKVSPYRPGHHPNSVAALAEHGIRPGEVRNPEGRNGWESSRRIREAFGRALQEEVGGGQTLLDVLVARAAHFAQTGSARDLYELLRYVSPPTQRFDAELGLSTQLQAELEEHRRRGPYCLEPFTSEAECVEAAPEGSEAAN